MKKGKDDIWIRDTHVNKEIFSMYKMMAEFLMDTDRETLIRYVLTAFAVGKLKQHNIKISDNILQYFQETNKLIKGETNGRNQHSDSGTIVNREVDKPEKPTARKDDNIEPREQDTSFSISDDFQETDSPEKLQGIGESDNKSL